VVVDGWATTLKRDRAGPQRGAGLPGRIEVLSRYRPSQFPVDTTITVADDGSTDDTLRVAGEVASRTPGPGVLHLDAKGRGLISLAATTRWSG
jgi:hypothetical protein